MWARFQGKVNLLNDAVDRLQGCHPRAGLAVDAQTQLHRASRYPATLGARKDMGEHAQDTTPSTILIAAPAHYGEPSVPVEQL